MSAEGWVTRTLSVRANHCAMIDVRGTCHCGRNLKHTQDDDEGLYCKRHGLQAYIDK